MADTIWYVYGIADPALDLAGGPPGLDDRPVALETDGDAPIAAVVSRVDATAYGPAAVEARAGDVAWLGPRAVAHDAVLTWASERGAIVPLPMFSMFSDAAGVRAMLRERAGALRRALDRVAGAREFALRVYRLDARLAASIAGISPRIAELEAAAAAAAPGQQYLLRRKLEGERKTEIRAVSAAVAREVLEALRAHARGTAVSPLPAGVGADAPGVAVLNAAFLVGHDDFVRFQDALTALAARHGPSGFHFDFTGPWPAYHFTGDDADGR